MTSSDVVFGSSTTRLSSGGGDTSTLAHLSMTFCAVAGAATEPIAQTRAAE